MQPRRVTVRWFTTAESWETDADIFGFTWRSPGSYIDLRDASDNQIALLKVWIAEDERVAVLSHLAQHLHKLYSAGQPA